jgi:hypothetical protein
MSDYTTYSEWKSREDVRLKANVFRRSDADYCPMSLPMVDGSEVDHSGDIDFILAFFEPVDTAERAEYERWRRERLKPESH